MNTPALPILPAPSRADIEACARALNLCGFLFRQMREIVPQDGASDLAINSFSDIGIAIADAAENAAWSAVEAFGKEACHD